MGGWRCRCFGCLDVTLGLLADVATGLVSTRQATACSPQARAGRTLRPRCPFADRKPEKHVATRKDRSTPRETIGSYCYGVKEAGNIGFPSPPSLPPCHAPPRRVVARTPAVPWQ